MSSTWSGQKKRSPVCMAAKARNAKAATDHGTYGVKRQFASSASDPPSQRSKAPSRESRSPNRPQRHSPAPQRKSPRTVKRGKGTAGEQSVQEERTARSTVRKAVTGKENDQVDNDITSNERYTELTSSLETCETRKKSPSDRIVYTRDELMTLRKSEFSNKIHEDLDERYVVGKKWNPDLWHQSIGPEQSNREQDKEELYETKAEGKHEMDNAGDSTVDLRPHMGKSQTFRSSHRTGYENDNGLEWRRGKHSFESDGWEGKGGRRRTSDNGEWQLDHKRRPRLNSQSRVLSLEQPSVWSDEEEPEWMTHGPTSQLEFIELRGFDDEEQRREMVDNTDNQKGKPEENIDQQLEEKSENLYDNGEAETADSKLIGFDFDDFLKSASSFTETVEPIQDSSLTNLNSSRFTQYFSTSEQASNHQTASPANHLSSDADSEGLAPGVAALFQSANFSSNRQIPPLAVTEEELRQNDSVDHNTPTQLQMFSRMGVLTQSKDETERAMSQSDMTKPGGRNDVLDGELEISQNLDGVMETRDRNKVSSQPRVPATFLPTAVIRKMHHEGHLQPGQLNDKIRSDLRHARMANSSPTALSDVSDSSRMRILQEHQMRQQELLWQQQRARQEFIRQRQILHEQQIGRQRELQRRALLEAEMKRRQAQLLTLRKFAIDRGLPPDTDPRVLFHLLQQYQLQKMRQMQLHQLQQQQQQRPRSLSPVSQAMMAQQMARLGVRVPSSGQLHGASGGDAYRLKGGEQSSGGKSPGRNSPVAFTGTPPPSLRPIPHHPLPQLTHEQLLAAHRARLLQQSPKESESAAVAALSKWFGQQQLSNTSDGVTNLEHMMSVKELEQNQTE